jgi:hypothetical protein
VILVGTLLKGKSRRGTWFLNWGLVKRKVKKRKKRLLKEKIKVCPLEMKVERERRELNLKELGGFMLLARLQVKVR